MRRSPLARLPAPVFLVCCIVWATWSVFSLVCRVLIWILLQIITASGNAAPRFQLRESHKSNLLTVCTTRPTQVPARSPARIVPLPGRDLSEQEIKNGQCVDNTEREDKIKRLMLALGIKHREFAENVVDKGYPVGW